MTTDRLTVQAMTPQDAQDLARRQWERDGLRVVGWVGKPEAVADRWRVTAEVELDRRRKP